MCLPCKVVINGGFTGAAARASMIRDQMAEWADRTPEQPEDDDLYELAVAEVEAIEAVRKAGVAMARRVGASERWRKLMERL